MTPTTHPSIPIPPQEPDYLLSTFEDASGSNERSSTSSGYRYPLLWELTLLTLSYSELPPSVTARVCKFWEKCTDSNFRLKLFFIEFEKYHIQYFNELYKPALIKIINKRPPEYTQDDKKVLFIAFGKIYDRVINPLKEMPDSNSKTVLETLNYIGYFDPLRPRIAFEWNKWREFIERGDNHNLLVNKLGDGFEENIILPILSRTKRADDVLAPLQLSQCIYLLYIFSIAKIELPPLYKAIEKRVEQDSSSIANSEMTYELYYTYSLAIEGTEYNKDLHKYLFESFFDSQSIDNLDQLGYIAGAAGNFEIQALKEEILRLTDQFANDMSFANLIFCIKSLMKLNTDSERVSALLEIAQAKISPEIADIRNRFITTQQRIEFSHIEDAKIISEYFGLCRKASDLSDKTKNLLSDNTKNLLIAFCGSCKIECLPADEYLNLLSTSLYFQVYIGNSHIELITSYIANNLSKISNDNLYLFLNTGTISIKENTPFRNSLTKHILYANFKYEPKLLIEIQEAYYDLSPKSIDENNAISKIWDTFLDQIENDDLYLCLHTGTISIKDAPFRNSLTKHILYANFKYEPKLLIEIQKAYYDLSPKSIDENNAISKIWDTFLDQIENDDLYLYLHTGTISIKDVPFRNSLTKHILNDKFQYDLKLLFGIQKAYSDLSPKSIDENNAISKIWDAFLDQILNDDLYHGLDTGTISIKKNVLFRASLTKHILYANFKYEPKLLIEIQRAYSDLSPKSNDEQNAIHKIWGAFLEQIESVSINELLEMHEIIASFPRPWEFNHYSRLKKLAAFNATKFEDLAQVHRLVKIYIQTPRQYFPRPLFVNIANFIAGSDSNNPLYLELKKWSYQYFDNLLDIELDHPKYT